MQTREAEPDEWARVRELRLRALRADPTAFGARFEEERDEDVDAWRARWTPTDARTVQVAEDATGALVGLAGGMRDEDDATSVELFGLWVAPEARGGRVGRALVEGIVAWARGAGAEQVTLWVNLANESAVRLYERCGFARVGEPRRGTRDPTRTYLRMARRVDA